MNIKRTNKRKIRVRAKIHGSPTMPRLSVFRSNTAFYAQLIDDQNRKTLLGVSEKQLEDKKGAKGERAKALGFMLGKKAKQMKITKVIFDRGSYAYHGRVKSFAQGAREGGLEF